MLSWSFDVRNTYLPNSRRVLRFFYLCCVTKKFRVHYGWRSECIWPRNRFRKRDRVHAEADPVESISRKMFSLWWGWVTVYLGWCVLRSLRETCSVLDKVDCVPMVLWAAAHHPRFWMTHRNTRFSLAGLCHCTNKTLHGVGSLRGQQFHSNSRNSRHRVDPESLLLCSEEPATSHCFELDEAIPRPLLFIIIIIINFKA
jgi:hypothetical protein